MRKTLKLGDRCTTRKLIVCVAAILFGIATPTLFAADTTPDVSLDVKKAAPRAVEELTQRSIVRDYKLAWAGLALALQSNSTSSLNALFEGTASQTLRERVSRQQTSGITSHFTNQTHKLQAVFYAPEGDVIELQDTAEYDIQTQDGDKTIHTEHALVRYIVLMTPGADRWVIRQLQAVPQF